MMNYYAALTKDSIGARKFKAQTDQDDIKFDEEVIKKKQKKIDSETLSIANAIKASKEVRRRAIEKRKGREPEDVDDIVAVHHAIDDALFAVQVSDVPPNKSTKIWSSRPDHWQAIVEHMNSQSYESACKMYASDLAHLKGESKKSTLYRWKRDFNEGKVLSVNKDRLPKYGVEVDQGLSSDITVRTSLGLPIDNVVLRELLLVRLESTNQMGLLRENGGNHVFGDCWARRFWKRNGFVYRVATSKMRELPTDLPDQKDTYARICAKLIYKYKIVEDVVINLDETGVQYVQFKKKTIAKKGTKRIRLKGKGSDKAQITVTLG
jgi:hypothetical protein